MKITVGTIVLGSMVGSIAGLVYGGLFGWGTINLIYLIYFGLDDVSESDRQLAAPTVAVLFATIGWGVGFLVGGLTAVLSKANEESGT